jgi:subtilase family serine protease
MGQVRVSSGYLCSRLALIGAAALVLLTALVTQAATPPGTTAFPLRFEANEGQADGRADYVARGAGYRIFLTRPGAVVVLQAPAAAIRPQRWAPRTAGAEGPRAILTMSPVGAQPEPSGVGEGAAGTSSYLLGSDPSRWRRNVPAWSRVRYPAVYPGVDLVYYGNHRRLEYDFVVHPGADPSVIRVAIAGRAEGQPAPGMLVDPEGGVTLRTGAGQIHLRRPFLYQEIDGARRPVSGAYRLVTAPTARDGEVRAEVGFAVGAYDPAHPLVIDPVVDYSTYLGGTGNDAALALAVDGAGNAHVAGYTESLDFPADASRRQAGTEAFVARLDPTGTRLLSATYLGGGGTDVATGVAVDASGAVYLSGYTDSLDFPVVGGYQVGPRGGFDAFVARLAPDGTALAYSSYLGGAADDFAFAVATDGAGHLFLAGATASTDYPRLNSVQGDRQGTDAIVSKVDTTATGPSSLVYSSYFGGGGADEAHAIAVDAAGVAYVAGWSDSTNLAKVNAYQSDRAGRDAFVAALPATGAPLLYATYLGGNGADAAFGLALDPVGRLHVTGTTDSTNFPLVNPGRTVPAGTDAFLAVLDPRLAGVATLVASTYLGGAGADAGVAVAVDAEGHALVAGSTASADLSTVNPIHGPRGGTDAFVLKLDPFAAGGARLLFSSYLGGTGDDHAHAVATDAAGALWAAGVTVSSDFPVVGGLGRVAAGFEDAFVTRLSSLDTGGPDLVASAVSVSPSGLAAGATATVTDTTSNDGQAPAAATTTRFYLSIDQFLDGADVLLGARAVPVLAPAESSTGTTTLIIPAGTQPGRYYVIANADGEEAAWESDETNNTSVSAAVAVGPDLTVAPVIAPLTAGAGGPVTVGNTVRNQGPAAAAATTVVFYLSRDTVLDAADVRLGDRPVPPLGPGTSSVVSTTLTIPVATAAGSYHVIAVADPDGAVAESDEANNTAASGTMAVGPDLVVADVGVPSRAAPGTTMTVTDTTTNLGGGAAAGSTTTFYFSADAALDASDVVLGSRAVPGLAAGAASQGSTAVTVPAEASGRFYVIARANADAAVSESDAANNVRVSVQVRVGPDLVVARLQPPGVIGAGATIAVTDEVRNDGVAPAGESVVRFYLSRDAIHDAGDVLLGSRTVPALTAGAVSSGTASLTVPAATTTGRYSLIARADADDAVAEIEEANNSRAEPVNVGPDLLVDALALPFRGSPGLPITITDTTRNRGDGEAPASATRFYLSADAALDAGDVLLGSRPLGVLSGGAQSVGSTTLVIPADTPPGNRYVIAVADGEATVVEFEETNNVRAQGLGIGADLVVWLDVPAGSVVAAPGQPLPITDHTRNDSSLAVPASVTRFLFSRDAVLDQGDTAIGTRPVPALDPHTTSTVTTTLTLPATLEAGTYYLFAEANADGAVVELDRTNNVSAPWRIVVGTDLTAWLELPAGSERTYPGASVTITASTKNLSGVGAPASTTHFYFSADQTLDAGDVLIGTRAVGVLAAGGIDTAPVTVTIPAAAAGGSHYVLAKADGPDVVTETDETNNFTAPARMLQLGADLTATLDVPGSAWSLPPGASFTVTETTRNNSQVPAPASATRFHLSADAALDGGDLLLASRAVPALAPFTESTAQTTLSLPPALGGIYRVIARVDADGTVVEVDETNNVAVSVASVKIGSDLVVSADVPASVSVVAPGASITVTDVTRNNSAVATAPSTVRFHLSSDQTLDAGDAVLGTRAVPGLGAFSESVAQTTLTLPVSMGAGTYYVIPAVNQDGAVVEFDATNNVGTPRRLIIGADLTAWVEVPAGSERTYPGGTLTVVGYTKNLSGVTAPASTTHFHLSTDQVLDGADPLVGTRVVAGLAPGGLDSAEVVLAMPAGIAGGTYYVLARADGPDAVSETDESNNFTGPARLIRVGGDLITMLDVPGSAWALAAGATFAVTDTTRNSSQVPVVASTTRFHLSTDGTLDAGDPVLGSRAVPALAPFTEHAAQTTLGLPPGLGGVFRVIARADADGVVAEVDTTNNTSVSTATVKVGSDMIVALDVPAGGFFVAPGATITVTDVTRNNSAIAAPPSTTRVYLSADPILDAADQALGSRTVPGLAPYSEHAGQTAVTLPGTLNGTFYLIALTNADTTVVEYDRTNNVSVSGALTAGADLTVYLDVPAVASNVAAGAAVTVSDATHNGSSVGAAPSVTRFYVSTDAVFDAADVVVGQRAVPALAAGADSVVQTTLTLPATLAGTFYLIAVADADGTVPEYAESNNVAVSRALMAATDLTLFLDVPASATAVAPGAIVTVTDTVYNGSVAAGASTTRFYLSADAVVDATDVVLGQRPVPALAPSGQSAGPTALTLPSTLAGTFYLIAVADADGAVVEHNEANNVAVSRPLTAGSDLRIALDVPAEATTVVPGAIVTVSDTVYNGSVAVGASTARFYVSADAVLDATDAVVGQRPVPALGPSGTSTAQTALTLPATLTGTFYLIAVADADGAVIEHNETNNAAVSRALTAGSDLTVSLDTGPVTTVAPGGSLTVTDYVYNASNAAAAASTTRFYLSTDTVLDAGDAVIGQRAVPAVAGTSSSTGATTVTVPLGAAGTYYVIARADADDVVPEVNEANNLAVSRAISVGADLIVVLDLSGGSAQVAAGAPVTVTDYTRNLGASASGPSTTMFYLSVDPVLDAGDIPLGSRAVPALAVGETSSATNVLALPSGLAGVYHVLARADAEGAVGERDESNNLTASTGIEIGPDLVVPGVTAPAVTTPAATLYISDTTKNRGAGSAAASTTRIYLSADALLDAGDLLLGARAVASLTPGAYTSGTTTVVVPTVAPGRYTLLVVADAGAEIPEVSEQNNVWAQPIDVLADLVVSAISAPSKAYPGSTVTVTDTTTNRGAAAGPTTTSVYLSADTALDGADLPLASRSVDGLDVGGSSTGSVSVALPADLAAGTYYFIAVADSLGAVGEASEANNTRTKSVTIGPDLTVSALAPPDTAAVGATIAVSETTRNLGSAADASVTRYHLSADTTLDPADVAIGARVVPALGLNAVSSEVVTLTIPAGIPAGSYYLIGQADADGVVTELVETNNLRTRAITITP